MITDTISERAQDERDLDILHDLQEGHSEAELARHYDVSLAYVRALKQAWELAA